MSITVCFRYKQIPTVTSLQPTSTVKKSAKITFSSDKIYYNFSPRSIQRLQIYCKIPKREKGTLCLILISLANQKRCLARCNFLTLDNYSNFIYILKFSAWPCHFAWTTCYMVSIVARIVIKVQTSRPEFQGVNSLSVISETACF